ncbi:MAG: hypothetical protein R2854_28145 [Caldilineaceae bacterium]
MDAEARFGWFYGWPVYAFFGQALDERGYTYDLLADSIPPASKTPTRWKTAASATARRPSPRSRHMTW